MTLGVRPASLASEGDSPTLAPFSRGQRLADALTTRLGSWPFIIGQSVLLVAWLLLNTMAWQRHWDPYPFILLNLALSFQAAYSAPIIMMSQNRQAAKDRRAVGADAAVNQRSELDVALVHARLDELTGRQWRALVDLQHQQLALLTRLETLADHAPPPTTRSPRPIRSRAPHARPRTPSRTQRIGSGYVARRPRPAAPCPMGYARTKTRRALAPPHP
jgi:uncharacterized membrane protein